MSTCVAPSLCDDISGNNSEKICGMFSNKDIDFDTQWNAALEIVRDLMDQKNVCRRRWHDLFSIVFNICTWDPTGYERIVKLLNCEFNVYVSLAEKRVTSSGDIMETLKLYIKEWDRYYLLSQYLPLPFRVRNSKIDDVRAKVYNLFSKSCGESEIEVRNIMFTVWSDMIFKNLKTTLWSAAEKLIEDEREGMAVDQNLIKGVRQSYVLLCPDTFFKMELYESYFLKNYIKCTEDYYRIKTCNVKSAWGIRQYLDYMNRKLLEEEKRSSMYLNNDEVSKSAIEEVLIGVLVEQFLEEIIGEVRSLIKDNDVEKLSIIYTALNRTKTGIASILEILKEYITEEGLTAMRENSQTVASDPEKFVEQLLEMFNKFTLLIDNAFDGDIRFKTIRDVAFKVVVNSTEVFKMEMTTTKSKGRVNIESRCPELLANYCDLLLRKSSLSKKLSTEEVDRKLRDLLLVLKYVNSKDIFIKYHKNHLSRRLIMDACIDVEREENIVNQFKECGMPTETIGKMYRMLQDMDLNKEFNTFIKNSRNHKNNNRDGASTANNVKEKDIDILNVKILNEGAWGRGKDFVSVSLNDNLEEAMHSIEDLYKFKHKGRKLSWIHQWSHGTMTFTSKNGKYDLDMSAFQMAVINCFYHCPTGKLSFESLKMATKLPVNELTRTLISLTCFPKIKSQVLLTDLNAMSTRSFNDSTLFWINNDFFIVKNNTKQSRGKLNLVGRLQLATEVSSQMEQDEIITLRELRTQEAITKIMKMRKECYSGQLESEIIEMLKNIFHPNKKLIKEQIEYLIDEKVIERSKKKQNFFVYCG